MLNVEHRAEYTVRNSSISVVPSNPASADGKGRNVLESSSTVLHGGDNAWAEKVRTARMACGSIPNNGPCWLPLRRSLPLLTRHLPTSDQSATGRAHPSPLWSLRDTLPAKRLPGTQSLSGHISKRSLPCLLPRRRDWERSKQRWRDVGCGSGQAP